MPISDKVIRVMLWGPLVAIFCLVPLVANNSFPFYLMFFVIIAHSVFTKGGKFNISSDKSIKVVGKPR